MAGRYVDGHTGAPRRRLRTLPNGIAYDKPEVGRSRSQYRARSWITQTSAAQSGDSTGSSGTRRTGMIGPGTEPFGNRRGDPVAVNGSHQIQ